jgi:prepilin-type processing-associated H-X9-DG protein
LDDVVQRHDRHESVGCIVTFADGHTAFIRAEEIPNLQWTVEE